MKKVTVPRAVRLNNPGNIELGGDRWMGMSKDQPDPRFVKFDTPEYGIRAMCRIFMSYRKRGICTVQQIIDTWAPAHENPTEKYTQNVCTWTGLDQDEDVTQDKYPVLIPGIIRQEVGYNPYSESTILAGCELASPRKN